MLQLGKDIVRKRYAERLPVTDRMPYPEAAFVQRWLDRQDLKATIGTTFVSILTLAFAAIAAWPVVKDWIGRQGNPDSNQQATMAEILPSDTNPGV